MPVLVREQFANSYAILGTAVSVYWYIVLYIMSFIYLFISPCG